MALLAPTPPATCPGTTAGSLPVRPRFEGLPVINIVDPEYLSERALYQAVVAETPTAGGFPRDPDPGRRLTNACPGVERPTGQDVVLVQQQRPRRLLHAVAKSPELECLRRVLVNSKEV